jgi:hypothetical protein
MADAPATGDEFEYLMGLRWYLRYPIAIALIAGSVAAFPWIASQKPEWVAWTLSGFGIVSALVIAYELGCLALVLAGIAVAWALAAWVVSVAPEGTSEWVWKAGIIAMAVIAYWWAEKSERRIKASEQSVTFLRSQVRELDTRIDFLHEELHRRAPNPRWHDSDN